MTRDRYSQLAWTDELVDRFWRWQSQFPEQYFTYGKNSDRIVRRLAPWLRGKKTVLDYGCGTGSLITALAKHGVRVTGADFSEKSVQATIERNQSHPEFAGAYIVNDLVARNDRFDAIVCTEVIEHLDDRYLARTLENIKRLSSLSAHVIFTTPHQEDLRSDLVYCPSCEHEFHRYQHVRSWSERTLSECLRLYGFRILDVFTTNLQRGRRSLRAYLNWHLKRMLSVPDSEPHLVCICTPDLG